MIDEKKISLIKIGNEYYFRFDSNLTLTENEAKKKINEINNALNLAQQLLDIKMPEKMHPPTINER